MAEYLDELNVKVMVGVGAAFDVHTGRIKDAPAWVKKIGMQWLHRVRKIASGSGSATCGTTRGSFGRFAFN